MGNTHAVMSFPYPWTFLVFVFRVCSVRRYEIVALFWG
jgi:hypothetical protein